MTTSYLINQAYKKGQQIAPWDQTIPLLPPLKNGEEDRRLLKIENIVTTSSSKSLALKKLTKKHTCSSSKKKINNKKKDDNKFSSLRFKSRDPWATTLLFSSGNQVVAGTKSQSQAILAHHSFISIISELTKERSTLACKFRIQNMVASCHYGYNIDIPKLSENKADVFSYDPKLFPGARGKIPGHKTSILLFSSGNGVITGAKIEDEIVKSFDACYHLIRDFFLEKSDPHADKGERYKNLSLIKNK